MRDTPRMQVYLSPTYDRRGVLDGFSVSINHEDISFEMIELSAEEVNRFIGDMIDQVNLLSDSRQVKGHIEFPKPSSDDAEVK